VSRLYAWKWLIKFVNFVWTSKLILLYLDCLILHLWWEILLIMKNWINWVWVLMHFFASMITLKAKKGLVNHVFLITITWWEKLPIEVILKSHKFGSSWFYCNLWFVFTTDHFFLKDYLAVNSIVGIYFPHGFWCLFMCIIWGVFKSAAAFASTTRNVH